MPRKKLNPLLFMIILTIVALMCYQGTCFAQEEEEQKPERFVSMAVEFPGIEIPAGEDVEMDVVFHNEHDLEGYLKNLITWGFSTHPCPSQEGNSRPVPRSKFPSWEG